jgi:hypothetical protein
VNTYVPPEVEAPTRIDNDKRDEQIRSKSERLLFMKNATRHSIAEVPHRKAKVELMIGIDLGDVWSH